jgi:cytidyltransferase-like protein
VSIDKIVAVSGGFDPVHIGHIRYLKGAAELGKVVVMLNTDEWLIRKKGKPFMPYDERKEILEAIKYVYKVVPVVDKGNSVAESIRHYKPHIFAKGGDRTIDKIPQDEKDAIMGIGGSLVINVGGGKIQSSSWLIKGTQE